MITPLAIGHTNKIKKHLPVSVSIMALVQKAGPFILAKEGIHNKWRER